MFNLFWAAKPLCALSTSIIKIHLLQMEDNLTSLYQENSAERVTRLTGYWYFALVEQVLFQTFEQRATFPHHSYFFFFLI